ncbi:MAG: hypothetical protein HC802_12030 [Caldilineaceae bacterium]|nr:hypothetical protein [Caldilineaceae bacterium]
MQPVKVILNPYSGRGGGGQSRDLIHQALQAAGVPFELEETNAVGHAIELAQTRAQVDMKRW